MQENEDRKEEEQEEEQEDEDRKKEEEDEDTKKKEEEEEDRKDKAREPMLQRCTLSSGSVGKRRRRRHLCNLPRWLYRWLCTVCVKFTQSL